MSKWKEQAECLGLDTNLFFDKYEETSELASAVDNICKGCPINRQCFAVGVSNKEWGVWGGVYLKEGKIDREFNKHKEKLDWFNTWQSLTMEDK